MKQLEELLNTAEPAVDLIRGWAASAIRPVELLPPSDRQAEVLVETQVTTRSPMGAVAYETGGILVDRGWLRILGSGHPRLTRTLPGWNAGRPHGMYLVADDVAGGFFALNGGLLGPELKSLYYFAPDSLEWEPMSIGYTDFLQWVFSGKYDQFCQDLRWPGWEEEISSVDGDSCLMSFPPLWTRAESGERRRGKVSVNETWGVQMDFRRQLKE